MRERTTSSVRRLLDGRTATDPAAGERAPRNEPAPDSWEYVMPWQVRDERQRRRAAGGFGVRVARRPGPGAAASAGGRPVGRS